MIRRNPLTSLIPLLAASALGLVLPSAGMAASGDAAGQSTAGDSSPIRLTSAHATLYYDSALTGSEMLRRVHGDMERLGLPIARTYAAANAVIVGVSQEEARAALASAEGIPIQTVAPAYHRRSTTHADNLLAFTSRLQLTFEPTVSERAKQDFFRRHGLTSLYETPSGAVMVETGRHPDDAMVRYAATIGSEPGIARSTFEFMLGARPTAAAATSIQVTDPYYSQQWPLHNDGENTNFGFGRADSDIDAPRAWGLLQGAGSEQFGNPIISVAVMDSGVELNHPDLALSIDSTRGRDFVDGGLPDPTRNTLGAHGTAMAGIIAAQANTEGIIGVAPGVKIYPARIFGPDYSATNTAIVSAIDDTISKGIDISLHAYALTLDCGDSYFVADIENAFRRAFESGRSGLGIPSIAASGNFFSQTDYPGHGRYVINVGSVSAEDNRILQSNWGGTGVDIVMPSYRINPNAQGDQTYGTGIVTTDLVGPEGFAGSNPIATGNSTRLYGALGLVNNFNFTNPSVASSYLGTSVSSAFAAGTVALLLNDERYSCLPPLIDYGPTETRASRRLRALPDSDAKRRGDTTKDAIDPSLCPLRENGDNLLATLINFSDLPAPSGSSFTQGAVDGFACGFDITDGLIRDPARIEYVDQYNEFLGHGRPNPAKALNDTAVYSPDSFFTGLLKPAPLVSYTFGSEAEAGKELDPEARASLTGGWKAVGDDDGDGLRTRDEEGNFIENSDSWLVANVPVDATGNVTSPIIISPFLSPFTALYVENALGGVSELKPESSSNRLYAWTDSLAFGGGTVDVGTPPVENVIYNPLGRYRRSTPIEVEGPDVSLGGADFGVPAVVELQIGHELGVEDSSSANAISQELDPLNLNVSYKLVDEDGNEFEVTDTIATIYGDSTQRPKQRLCPSVSTGFGTPPVFRPIWDLDYAPYVEDSEMIIRTYKFVMPPIPEGAASLRFSVRLALGSSNNSYLPSYRSIPQAPFTEQMSTVFRDQKGFILYGLKMTQMRTEAAQYLADSDHHLTAEGYMPTFTVGRTEVLFAQRTGSGSSATYRLAANEARGEHLKDDRQDFLNRGGYAPTELLQLPRITGLKANPVRDLVAITTADGKIWTATSDGAALTQIGTLEGAVDPAWNVGGDQLLVASSTKIIAITNVFTNRTVATVIDGALDSVLVTNFRSPVFDPDAGVVYFTAIHKNDPAGLRRIYLSTRAGRVITTYNKEAEGSNFGQLLSGFADVNTFDLDISESGRRLIFVAETDFVPELGGDGSVKEPALLSTTVNSIITVENIHWVTQYRNVPIYKLIPFPFSGVRSARYPRLSLDDVCTQPRIAYTTYFGRVGTNSFEAPFRIGIQEIDKESTATFTEPPAPTPAPTITTPVVTPPPIDRALVVQMGEFDFESSVEGWTFASAAPAFTAPESGWTAGTNTVDGSLRLVTRNDSNTFGYWVSALPAFTLTSNNLYMLRAHLRPISTTDASRVPAVRLRANSLSTEHSAMVQTESRGNFTSGNSWLSSTPGETRSQDLLISPPAGLLNGREEQLGYLVSFDLVNLDGADDANGGLSLERLEVFRLDNAPRHVALWCFEVPDGETGTVAIQVKGTNGLSTPMTVEIRGCCGDPDTSLSCATGNSLTGVSLSPILGPGNYTVVATTAEDQEVELTLNSTVELTANCVACVTTKEANFDTIGDACQTSTAVGGTNAVVRKRTFYEGTGFFALPACDTNAVNTVAKQTQILYDNTLDTPETRAELSPVALPDLFAPASFSSTETGVGMNFSDLSRVGFGYYVLDGTDVPSGAPTLAAGESLIYRATFVLSSQETDFLKVPVLRMRLSTSDFQRTAFVALEPGTQGNVVPTAGKPKEIELYLVLERVPVDPFTQVEEGQPLPPFQNLVVAFDAISAYTNRPASSFPVVLESIKVERVIIPSYPAR